MKRKTIFIILVSMFLATLLVFGFTNARYSYSANTKGNMDLLQTKCSLELYNPSSVTGSTSGATYKTENGTSYFAVPSIPTDYTNINYKVNNKVSNVINQKEIQYYIRVVAADGSTNMPIEYNVHKYNDASSKYSLVSGWGYGPFTLQKNTEYSGTNGMFSIEANYKTIDSNNPKAIKKMKVQMVAKSNSGNLIVLSEAPMFMKLTDETPPTLNSITFTKSTYLLKEPISATISAIDNETGLDTTNCKYIFTNSNTAIGTSSSSYTGGSLSSDSKVSTTITTQGNYYLHVLLKDKAGNLKEAISSKIVLKYATVNVTEVVQGTAYSNGKDGFTFEVYVNGGHAQTGVKKFTGSYYYGDVVRVVANAVSGYKLDNADVTKTVTSETLEFNPSWYKYQQATLKTYAEMSTGTGDGSVKVDSFDSATNVYTITQKAGTPGWGVGTIADATGVTTAWGRTYVLEFDIKVSSTKLFKFNVDANNEPISGSKGSNDNYLTAPLIITNGSTVLCNDDNQTIYLNGGISLNPNIWYHVKLSVPNNKAEAGYNPNKETVRNFSAFGFNLTNSTTDFTYQMKNFNSHTN